jgi:hypothetical protein
MAKIRLVVDAVSRTQCKDEDILEIADGLFDEEIEKIAEENLQTMRDNFLDSWWEKVAEDEG